MRFSRYAVKKMLREAKHNIASKHGLKYHVLSAQFSDWLVGMTGRNVELAKDEKMRAELEWLRSLDKRLTGVSKLTPPDKFCPWFNPGAPLDASSPYDFHEVYIWREGYGVPKKIQPSQLPPTSNVANLYWRPVFVDEPDLSRPN